MILYRDALKILLSSKKMATKRLSVTESYGYVSAETISSNVCVPPFHNSAMDGYAVRLADIAGASPDSPIELPVTGQSFAGDHPVHAQGGAWEIMTGACIPTVYDSVVKVEDTKRQNGNAVFYQPTKHKNNIRQSGEDFLPGDVVINRGTALSSIHLMALSTIGKKDIMVYDQPKGIVFCTGNEVIDNANETLLPGQIRNSNGPYLVAEMREMNIETRYGGIIRDNSNVFEEKIRQAITQNNIIISTGAVSAGKHDFIPDSLRRLGAKIRFHKVSIRPGKPILYAQFENGAHYFGLPGNPISAAVGYRFFVAPLARHIQGAQPETASLARLEHAYSKRHAHAFFAKAYFSMSDNLEPTVRILDGQESFKVHPMLKTNSWVCLRENDSQLGIGDIVELHTITPRLKNMVGWP